MKRIFATAIMVISANYVHAETADVFCTNEDRNHWEWLENSEGNQVTISGVWGVGFLPNQKYFRYFSISESGYQQIKNQCQSNFSSFYIPQPANNRLSGWYLFKVNRSNGSYYYADGKYTSYNLPVCSPPYINCEVASPLQ